MNEKEHARLISKLYFGHPDGCYEALTSKPDCRGYRRFWYRGQWRQGHRITYVWLNDDLTLRKEPLDIPEDKPTLDHSCVNRDCWRPAHLTPMTLKKNHELRAMRYFERKRKALEEEAI